MYPQPPWDPCTSVRVSHKVCYRHDDGRLGDHGFMLLSDTILDFAETCGWHRSNLVYRQVDTAGTSLEVAKATIAGQPAALFAKVVRRNGADPSDIAALFGYHASVEWGVVVDENVLTVFNPHWLVDGRWFKFPPVSGEASESAVFRALSPRALRDGDLNRIAAGRRQPTDILAAVDEALVKRLDIWRDQALRYAIQSYRVDDLLQTLYAQLFVLRTIEDRHLDPGIPPLAGVVVSNDDVDRDMWARLLETARVRIGSDLFDMDAARNIPDHVVAGVILDLYYARGVPAPAVRYDFSWIDADVLGLAYEKYLATVSQPTSLPLQSDLFMTPERGVERVSVRRASGAYYTPKYITNFLATRCVDDYFAAGAEEPPSTIDFACGSGSFITAAVDRILWHLKSRDENFPWARFLVEKGYIAGIDIDEKAVTAARLHLWQRLLEEPEALPLPRLSRIIIAGDGLNTETWSDLRRSWDIALGNPPFLATQAVIDRDRLVRNFSTAKGRFDYSSLFVEQALRVLKHDGRFGLVIPNRLFKNTSGASLRDLLSREATLIAVLDFGTTRPFDADAYIGCLVAKKKQLEDDTSSLRVIEVTSLDATFVTDLLLQAKDVEGDFAVAGVRAFNSRYPRGDRPWSLISEEAQAQRISVEDASIQLDEIAAVPQGIKTGANDLFLVEVLSSPYEPLVKIVNGLGEEALIESALLESAAFGSQLSRYQLASSNQKIIYPYRNGVALSETELMEQYPYAWSYFARNRQLLGARASLKRIKGRFYEIIWPRDVNWLRRPKLLIRDLAPRTAFAADPNGEVFLVGGTAVVPSDSELLFALLAYLNSTPVNNLVQHKASQFRGSFLKFEPQHIQTIPVLKRIIEDPAFSGILSQMAEQIVNFDSVSPEFAALSQGIDETVTGALNEVGLGLDD